MRMKENEGRWRENGRKLINLNKDEWHLGGFGCFGLKVKLEQLGLEMNIIWRFLLGAVLFLVDRVDTQFADG